MASAAGIRLNWQDFSELSAVIPLLTRIYPNGTADVNAFQAAGGMAVLIGSLLDGGLLHGDVQTVAGPGLDRYRPVPALEEDGGGVWPTAGGASRARHVLRTVARPFAAPGGPVGHG